MSMAKPGMNWRAGRATASWSAKMVQRGDCSRQCNRPNVTCWKSSNIARRTPQKLLEERCEELQAAQQADEQPSQPPSLGSIAAVLFVASDPELPVSPHAGTCVYNLSVQDEMFNAATAGEKAQIVKRLLGEWVRRSELVDWVAANQSCILAVHYRLQEGIDLRGPCCTAMARRNRYGRFPFKLLLDSAESSYCRRSAPLLADRSEVAERSGRG